MRTPSKIVTDPFQKEGAGVYESRSEINKNAFRLKSRVIVSLHFQETNTHRACGQ